MSEEPVKANTAEAEFQASINKIVESSDFSNDAGLKLAEKRLNEFLGKINKLNASRDLVAHVYKVGTDPKVDIFCRNVRMDELAVKLSVLSKDPIANKDKIDEIKAYIDSIRRIGLFN
jgi:hypothetical protein